LSQGSAGLYSKASNRSSALVSQSAAPAEFKSKVEEAILRSAEPIQINETQQINAGRERGIWANKCEVCTWKGDLPIQEYPINEDNCPCVIKKPSKRVEYTQEINVRYLKPPAPPTPGPIIVKQEPNKPTAPAPPVIIRQQPPRPCTPEPLVIREAPPNPPPCVPQQVVTIPGKKLPAPPRKVVVERLAPIPPKPQPVIIERWMPYQEQKRRVIYQAAPPDPVPCKPKNIIVQWEAPEVCIKKEIKHLGVVCANPCEYIQKYGSSLKKSCELPQFVKDIPPQCGVELAANKPTNPCPVFELCGDVCALNLVPDLEKEGLGAYKNQVREKCGCPPPPSPPPCPPPCPQPNPCDDPCAPPCPPPCPSPRKSSASCSGKCPVASASGSASASSFSSGSAKYGSASVYGSGSASAQASGSAYGSASGSVSAQYATGSAYGAASNSAQFSSGYGYGSASSLYGASEAGNYSPISFNY